MRSRASGEPATLARACSAMVATGEVAAAVVAAAVVTGVAQAARSGDAWAGSSKAREEGSYRRTWRRQWRLTRGGLVRRKGVGRGRRRVKDKARKPVAKMVRFSSLHSRCDVSHACAIARDQHKVPDVRSGMCASKP